MQGITFAIPYHSAPHYLIRALESVRHQTESQWELIVCDDSDGKQPIEQLVYSYDDPRMRYWRNECTLGIVGNWNRCLDMARSELVTILYGDQEIRPDYAAFIGGVAVDHPEAVAVGCASYLIDEHGREETTWGDRWFRWLRGSARLRTLQGEAMFQQVARFGWDMLPSACYRMARLRDRRFETMWTHVSGRDFIAQLLLDDETLVEVPHPLHARRRQPKARGNDAAERFTEELRLHQRLVAAARRRGWKRAERALQRHGPRLGLMLEVCKNTARLRLSDAWRDVSVLVQSTQKRRP